MEGRKKSPVILKKPITLNLGLAPLTVSDAFAERMTANYELLPARITPKELLFLTTAPPEWPEELGGMTAIAVSNQQNNLHEVSLNIVNNVVNRILLTQEGHFTYQDSVYITTVLQKLGVTDVKQFMKQVREMYEETVSIGRLNTVYRDQAERLETLLERTRETASGAEKGGGPEPVVLPAPRYYLHGEIYERLQTEQIYQTFCSLVQNRQLYADSLFQNELKVSEQSRVSQELSLWSTKQTILRNENLQLVYAMRPEPEEGEDAASVLRTEPPAIAEAAAVPRREERAAAEPRRTRGAAEKRETLQPLSYVTLHHHVNRYETGELLPLPETEEDVIRQSAGAVLLALTDQVIATQLHRLTSSSRSEQWIDIRSAVSQSVQNVLERYRLYHTENLFLNASAQVRNESLTALYRQEEASFLSLLRQDREVHRELSRLEAGEPAEAVQLVHRLPDASEEGGEAEGQDAAAREEAARQALAQEEKRKLSALTERILRTERAAAAQETRRAPSARPEPPAELRRALLRERETQLRERWRETVRELSGAETKMVLASQLPEAAPTLTQQTYESLQQLFRRNETFSRAGDRLLRRHVTVQEGPEVRENRYETVNLVQPKAGETPAQEEPARPQEDGVSVRELHRKELVRELDRINEHNREVLRVLQEETQRRERSAPQPQPPDPKKMFRDSLLAMQDPERFVKELAGRPAEQPRPQPQNAAIETILEHADPATRELYRMMLLYQQDPEAALATGLIHRAGTAEINAAVRESRTRELEELTRRQRETVETRQHIREQVDSVVDRYLETPASEPPAGQRERRPAAAHIVHRTQEPPVSEELMELLSQRQTKEVVRETEQKTVTREQVSETEINNVQKQVVQRTTEDIAEMINRTLAQQIGSISERVYGQMERRLQSERARRGWK